MITVNRRYYYCALIVAAGLISLPAYGESSLMTPWLPEKAFAVEGGRVSVRAGVMPNPTTSGGLPIGKLKYPTRYFIDVVNESTYPIWVDAAWTYPESNAKKPAKARTVRSSKVPPRGSYVFYLDKLGVIVDQAITVELGVYADEKRTKPIGSRVATMAFDQKSVDVFLANFPSPFKNSSAENKRAALLSGWRDIPRPRDDVPGSSADATLQADIQRLLWKSDSIDRWDCEREVLSATVLDIDDSRIFAELPEAAQQDARREFADNTLYFETWFVRSCGEELAYEALMSESRKGGTDVLIRALQ